MSRARRSVALAVLVGSLSPRVALQAQAPAGGTGVLRYVASARQAGPVAYQDPVGAISPDGAWLAHSVGVSVVHVRRVNGGAVTVLPPFDGRVRTVAWLPDSRRLMVESVRGRVDARSYLYDVVSGTLERFWRADSLRADTLTLESNRLRDLAWSPDGRRVAGVIRAGRGSQLWVVDDPRGAGAARVVHSAVPLASPVWTPDGAQVACVAETREGPRPSVPCGSAPDPAWDRSVYGPIGLAPDGRALYYATPNERGMLELWARPIVAGRPDGPPVRLTHFPRDTYAPTVARDGRVLFRTQVYETTVSDVPAQGGAPRALTTFPSMLPAWHPGGKRVGVTFGEWRTVLNARRYPDIGQDLAEVRVDSAPAGRAAAVVVHASPSEDQGMSWSPNGRWIAFHSHRDSSDGLWVVADGGAGPPRRARTVGFEAGWPRWSPDGRWIAYDAYLRGPTGALRRALLLATADQESGAVGDPEELALDTALGHPIAAGWLPDAAHLVVETMVPETDRRSLWVVSRAGGTARRLADFRHPQFPAGISVSSDGAWVAYVAHAPDGYDQIFRLPLRGGGPARQVTTDPSDKTQPAWSPDGTHLAFTVWRYEAQFWVLDPAP